MQPYLFPYIGYFQLINAVDKFVIHDDVQFIKAGWINRNRILVNHHEHLFTFSLKKNSSYLNINERYFSDNFDEEKNKLFRTLKNSYGKSKNFKEVFSLIQEILNVNHTDKDISKIITRSLIMICDYLKIRTPIITSSEMEKNSDVAGEKRVIEINKRLNSTHYINPIGGVELYSEENFLKHNIQLSFLKSRPINYIQNGAEFLPWLSIIDVLMFNTTEEIIGMLNEYDFVQSANVSVI